MVEKKTLIEQIEVVAAGHILVQMRKLVVDGDAVVHDLGYHRTSVECGGDCDAQLAAVNAHLESMGCGPVDAGAWQRVSAIAAAVWTPETVQAWQDAKSAAAKQSGA